MSVFSFSVFVFLFEVSALFLLGLTVVDVFVCLQLRALEWMEGDDFNTEAVMNICGECDVVLFRLITGELPVTKPNVFHPS